MRFLANQPVLKTLDLSYFENYNLVQDGNYQLSKDQLRNKRQQINSANE